MAHLLGHVAQLRLPILIGALAGCAAPISNAPFREEGAFLDALISADEVGPPEALATIELGESPAPLLLQSLGAVGTFLDFVALPVEISAQLVEVGPTRRTAVRRIWSPTAFTVPVAASETGGQRLATMWVSAEVLRIEEARFEVRVDVADAEDGAPVTIGTGLVDDGRAGWHWELDAVVDVLGLDVGPLDTLVMTMDPRRRRDRPTRGGRLR